MIKKVKSQPDNLYIIGLDYHVGYILKENNEVYFIHSNYIGNMVVMREKAICSEALKSSETFYLGEFLTNENIKKWLGNEEFRIDAI